MSEKALTRQIYRGTLTPKIALLAFLVAFGIMVSGSVLASSFIFTDYFDSYDEGALTGQGGWTQTNSSWQVQSAVKHSGTKAIYCASATDCGNWKSGDQVPTGRTIFFLRNDEVAGAYASTLIYFYGDPNGAIDNYRFIVSFDPLGKVNLLCNQGNWCEVGTYSGNNFIEVEVEWRDNLHDYRVRWEDKNWSSWYQYKDGIMRSWTYIDKIRFRKGVSKNGYIDTILGDLPSLRVYGVSPASESVVNDIEDNIVIGWEEWDFEGIYQDFIFYFHEKNTGLVSGQIIYEPGEEWGSETFSFSDFNIEKNGKYYLKAKARSYYSIEYGAFYKSDLVDPEYWIEIDIEGWEAIFEMPDWETWYGENVDRYATPTPVFANITGFLSPIFSKVGEFGKNALSFLDNDDAYQTGYDIGKIFPLFKQYIEAIDVFFGNFPLFQVFKAFLLILIGIFGFRLIMKFVPGLG